MSMIMNHDVTSLMGQRIMMKNSLAMKRSLEKLSSGLRTKIADIDNTAGLAISETMRSRIGGMEKALYNSQDGISMIQTASGALEQTQNMLMRMRELSVQAANDVLTQQDRSYIQVEINEIRDEIDLLASSTQFNRKKILSGDNAVLWSSTNNKVKAVINGGLRSIDKYGQKYAVDGNYKISVSADVGKAQVQKTDIFRVKHDDTITDKNVNATVGVKNISIKGDIPAGGYSLTLAEGEGQNPIIAGAFGIGQAEDGTTANVSSVFNIDASDGLDVNASVLFEVKHIDTSTNTISLKATASILSQEGVSSSAVLDDILLVDGADAVNLSGLFGEDSLSIGLNGIQFVSEGAKFVVSASAQNLSDDAIGINLTGIMDSTAPNQWDGGPFRGDTASYVLNGRLTGNSELKFRNFFVNDRSGEVSEGTILLETDEMFRSVSSGGKLNPEEDTTLANFKASYIGKVASGDTQLRDIDKFWDSDGNFILSQPRELTLTQGDGTQAKIMLYEHDTLNDLTRKLNDAVAIGLGQSKYVDDATKFASFVEGARQGFEGVEGTIVLRSVLTGTKGEITLSGNEDLLKAFSLNTIQDAKETAYNVTVRDAHDNTTIAENIKVTGNKLVGVIHKNIDVEFDPMLSVAASWNASTRNFDIIDTTGGSGADVVLHISDNTTVFQTGTSEGEDVMISIGDMGVHALGLDRINVMSREKSSFSISVIDDAIDRVSMQQAKLGAAQNRLEHHIGNLTDETEALVGANSRIRDTEYMSELLEFTKNKILMDSNAAMLAQANQIQQSTIISLLR